MIVKVIRKIDAHPTLHIGDHVIVNGLNENGTAKPPFGSDFPVECFRVVPLCETKLREALREYDAAKDGSSWVEATKKIVDASREFLNAHAT